MTTILAIDPGKTSGWVLYDTATRRPIRHGNFDGNQYPPQAESDAKQADHVVLEGMERVHAGIYPDTVTAAYHLGRMVERMNHALGRPVVELDRHIVKEILTDATLGSVRVKNDPTAWAAMILLHGEGCDTKGRKGNPRKGIASVEPGILAGVSRHARAALAVAVAFAIREGLWEAGR